MAGKRGPDKKPRKGSPRKGSPRKNSEEKPPKATQVLLIERMVDGVPPAKIAKEFGWGLSTVYDWMAKPEVAGEVHNRMQIRLEAARQRLRAGSIEVADALVAIGSGRKKGTPQQVMAARDVLNRAGVEAGEIVKHTGSLEALSDEELEARAEARRK